MELGNLVTDEAVLWKFIGGLQYNLKREVLREKHLTTLSDAVLAAERAEACEKFARFGHKGKLPRNDGSVPMDIDAMQKPVPKAPGKGHARPGSSNARAASGRNPSYTNMVR